MTEVEIRSYAPGDEGAILELFRSAFGRDMDQRDWAWRYLDNPADRPRILLACEDDTVVAHYAVSPVELRWRGRQRRAALSMTTMTHPAHQGRGFFVRLATRLYEQLAQDDYDIVFGFPNRQSHSGFTGRLEWRDHGYSPRLELAAGSPAFDMELARVSAPSTEFAGLVEQTAPDFVQPIRDASTLQWRYGDHPSGAYDFLELRDAGQLRGCAVVKQFEDGLDVLELGYDARETATELARALQSHAASRQLSALQLWLALDEPAYSCFERLGMVPREPVTFFGMRALSTDGEDMARSPWLLRMGLSDVY